MTLEQYIEHYTSRPEILIFFCVSLGIVALMHILIYVPSAHNKSKLLEHFEMYYEMIYSATAMLFFIGLYFLVTYRYFNVTDTFYSTWEKYKDFILLLVLVLSVVIINIIDNILVPLKAITSEHKATLRIMAMIYMMLIFMYIKYIYDDSNYDAIISYFVIMMIGRFVYFDASFKEFCKIIKNVFLMLPTLFLALCTTGALAWYGFGSGYLLKKNGVVLSLGIAHIFVVIIISVAHHVEKIYLKTKGNSRKRGRRRKSD